MEFPRLDFKMSHSHSALIFFFSAWFILMLNACSTSKKSSQDAYTRTNLDEIVVSHGKYEPYRAAHKRDLDLIHTKLKVSFDWAQAHLNGLATLTMKPYFYPANKVTLDAKGFELNKVQLITDSGNIDLKYNYKNDLLTVNLDRTYSLQDTFIIYIDYKAKPNELEVKGSSAISDAKGLYFINHLNEDKDKPQQIWTQGETESNSCWFPTIDKPNVRMTQEVYITIDTSFSTLSNGLLQYSTINGDGTRTDYWKQDLPHAPYLVMMAIGKYAIVKDHWRDIEVNYYVEPEYEQYAKSIFGATPEMLQFYSDKLGVDYPWAKYSQVIVRDYVSGAMENTSAVIFGEFVQQTDREILDKDHEDVVAHELFHHWFGDLVTCESWSNIPLNESFATYGEYLWNEYKHGRDEADYGLENDLRNYLNTSHKKQVDIIRFHYNDKEDMFDSHSYGKGGRVLHMLRKHVGDEAFFASLKLYLERNKFSSVEIHHLRLAFEEVTGEDLNWFFNQWFLSAGHPLLSVSYDYIDSIKTAHVKVEQSQDLNKFPLYTLPITIDIYASGKVERHQVLFDSISKTFSFIVSSKPDLINFDAEKMLLCAKEDFKTKEEWIFQYYNAPLYLDRFEALKQLVKYNNDAEALKVIEEALNDKHWNIRLYASWSLKDAVRLEDNKVRDRLVELARNDKEASVRSSAINQLAIYFHPDSIGSQDEELHKLYYEAIKDPSYNVMGQALLALAHSEHDSIMKLIQSFDEVTKEKLIMTLAAIYSLYGEKEQNTFFEENYKDIHMFEKWDFVEFYRTYLLRQDDETMKDGIVILEDAAINSKPPGVRLKAIYGIIDIGKNFSKKEEKVMGHIRAHKSDEEKLVKFESELNKIQEYKEVANTALARIREQEKNERVLLYWDLQ